MKHKLTSTDGSNESITTENTRFTQFAKDMNKAGIEWRFFPGDNDDKTPAVEVTPDGNPGLEDIIRATALSGLVYKAYGLNTIVYPKAAI